MFMATEQATFFKHNIPELPYSITKGYSFFKQILDLARIILVQEIQIYENLILT